MKALLIDNYDSFTYNLFDLMARVYHQEPEVIFNDSLSFEELDLQQFDQVVISPGPGHPDQPKDFGVCRDIILKGSLPVLGICLGHQGLYSAFGGIVSRAAEVIHGQRSEIFHHQDALFENIPSPFLATRYHSLICQKPLPKELQIIAQTQEGLIMGIRHRSRPMWGVQYHPESIISEHAEQLFKNFKALSLQYQRPKAPASKRKCYLPPKQQPKPTSELLAQIIGLGTHGQFYLQTKELPPELQAELAFERLFANQPYAVWLDSAALIPGFSRFSYMGAPQSALAYRIEYRSQGRALSLIQGQQRHELTQSIFDFLSAQLKAITLNTSNALPFEFQGGLIGYFGYELNQELAPVEGTKSAPHPDAQFLFLDQFLVFDHQESKAYALALSKEPSSPSFDAWIQEIVASLEQRPHQPSGPKPTEEIKDGGWFQSPDVYQAHIQACIDYIHTGSSYEICLTNKRLFESSCRPLDYYRRLRASNPAPHAAYLKLGDLAIASASMERFLKLDPHGLLETKPIKGTRPRSNDPVEDRYQALCLSLDKHYHSEHLMIVDLIRNDLSKVSQVGSVRLAQLMAVESYATVHQLISVIQGQIKVGLNVIDCMRHMFPGGSMTGAPKIRSMNFINQLESRARGIYSGALGYLSLNGAADLSIVIRTAEIHGSSFSMGTGGAIIALSNPQDEFNEIELKTKALVSALSSGQPPLSLIPV